MGCQPITTHAVIFNRLISLFFKSFKAPCPLTQTSFCERLLPNFPSSSLSSWIFFLYSHFTSSVLLVFICFKFCNLQLIVCFICLGEVSTEWEVHLPYLCLGFRVYVYEASFCSWLYYYDVMESKAVFSLMHFGGMLWIFLFVGIV